MTAPVCYPVLEEICSRGCRHVHRVIEALSSRRAVPELAACSKQQQRQILNELKAIMEIYQRPCELKNK